VLGNKAATLYELLRGFGDGERMDAMREIVAR
jgi:hypothetical protein